MKIYFSSTSNEYDYLEEEMRVVDSNGVCIGSESVYPLCECPEDAIIERDLIGCGEIIKYMKLAYEAGKNGEPLEIIKENEEDEE